MERGKSFGSVDNARAGSRRLVLKDPELGKATMSITRIGAKPLVPFEPQGDPNKKGPNTLVPGTR